ncbi:hypothetical protein WJU70_001006 [Enterobacter cloacae]|uniref:hypothetical protein n=1 Tax=Enterobacter TaxID=547 RepID=UPI0004A6D390|nr:MULTISPECIES: hypothetical protein [Enterobacter]MCK7164596.1 hypothetical protein [Enterobacter cloacae]MCL8313813.1 hypothetical protein [Enterobacter cloacae subsp. cloacae]QCC92807.1 hypothetical protein E7735_18445 [Enterobacter cloacae]QCC97807.1 hypothetical protein E7739_18140 [Enterobacter cloacae]QCD10262.1 hypothetical protein E7729_06480 [Enterobacter cloacae]
MIGWLRADLCDTLIWWMKPTKEEGPLEGLCTILRNERIEAEHPAYLHGSQACIAFSETPLIQAARLLLHAREAGINFAPYGIQFNRNQMYARGARQTIHQPADELNLLPDSQRYRHVTFDPEQGIDFTWKREWRLPANTLTLTPDNCHLILPDRTALRWLRARLHSPLLEEVLLLEHLL